MKAIWKDIVKQVAPALGTALGGPLAGAATKVLAEAFLPEDITNKTQTEIEQVLESTIMSASPQDLTKLRELDLSFKKDMAAVGVDVFKLEIEDKASARELAKLDLRPHIWLSATFIAGYFGLIWAIGSGEYKVAEDMKEPALILIGLLAREIPSILGFWFGSSFGSKSKDIK